MVQAQDYLGALWAVGLRAQNAIEADIDAAIARAEFVRTWPARGTLHFAAAQDVRWMLSLLAPRAIKGAAGRYRQLGLDEETFARSREQAAYALRGGNRLTREEMYQAFESAHISTEGQRGIHILGRLAQEGLICFGPRQGKQHVFVLLEEWLPEAEILPRDQALAELTRRYFTSHGPATVRDFAWWSGLTAADIKAGLEMSQSHLVQGEIDGQACWEPRSTPSVKEPSPTAHLLPAFEEYLLGYTERSAVLDPVYGRQMIARNGILSPIVVIDGQVVGAWKRRLKKGTVVIDPVWFHPPGKAQQETFRQAAMRYGAFLGLDVVVK